MQLLKIGNVLFKGLLMGKIFPAFPLDACISNGPRKQLTMILFQFALHPLPQVLPTAEEGIKLS